MTPRALVWHVVRLALLVVAAVVTATMLPGLRVVPDLVLPIVVATGLVRGPWGGILVGLLAGWVVDLVPPASSMPGTAALVYAAAGLVAGGYNRPGGQWWALPHVALASALAVSGALRIVLVLVAGRPADVTGLLVATAATGLLGVALVPLLVRLEVLGAPPHRAWLRAPR